MLKAIFLDLDETLCDTSGANKQATIILAEKVLELFGDTVDHLLVAESYLAGIYRKLDSRYQEKLYPVVDEERFRIDLIKLILSDFGIVDCSEKNAALLQTTFDNARTTFFDFFPGIQEWLAELRKNFKLVVITNGPEFSQVTKVERVNLKDHVDFILIGGLEPEQKPAASIFEKALSLVAVEKNEVIHVGDSLEADIKGANNVGIDSVWISHGLDFDESLGIYPTHIIEHPSQLRELIQVLHLANL